MLKYFRAHSDRQQPIAKTLRVGVLVGIGEKMKYKVEGLLDSSLYSVFCEFLLVFDLPTDV